MMSKLMKKVDKFVSAGKPKLFVVDCPWKYLIEVRNRIIGWVLSSLAGGSNISVFLWI